MAEIKYDIKKNLGSLGESSKGWSKELNIISWNERSPKIDIRDWDENKTKMGKGVTLTKKELLELKKILNEIDFDTLDLD
ncbi:hypothetical protein JXR93_13470 [bacterium]|nr:hypothetical protein [bacterium]